MISIIRKLKQLFCCHDYWHYSLKGEIINSNDKRIVGEDILLVIGCRRCGKEKRILTNKLYYNGKEDAER